MPNVFVSYRTADEKDFVFRIYDRFVDHYGEENVFIAPDGIPDFTYWEKFIVKELDKCHVVVSIIGPSWNGLLKEKSESAEVDYVVLEISHGFENQKLVAPICIKGSEMPNKDLLPEKIEGILDVQIGHVRDDANFRDDVNKRISFIDRELTERGVGRAAPKIESMKSMPIHDFADNVLRMLERGEVTRLKSQMRDFPQHILDLMLSDDNLSINNSAMEALDRLVAISTLSVNDEKRLLFFESLDCIREVFAKIDAHDLQTEVQIDMLLAIGKRLYMIGAMILREKRFDWVSGLVHHPEARTLSHRESLSWIYNLERKIGNADKLNAHGLIEPAREYICQNEFFFRQFYADRTRVTEMLCGFDFVRCLLDRYTEQNRQAYPAFGRYFHEMSVPVIKLINSDKDIRMALFGKDVDRAKVNERILDLARIVMDNRNNPSVGYWMGKGNPISISDVQSFLDDDVLQVF